MRKTAEYQRDHYDFWYRLRIRKQGKLFRSVLAGLLDWLKAGQSYWAPANDQNHRLCRDSLDQPAEEYYPSKGYNAYATGKCYPFDRARLLEDFLSTPMKWPITLTVQFIWLWSSWGTRCGTLCSRTLAIFAEREWTNYYTLAQWLSSKVDKDSNTYAYL